MTLDELDRLADVTDALVMESIPDAAGRHTAYTFALLHLFRPITVECMKRDSVVERAEAEVFHDGHKVWIDHDEVNVDTPWSAMCWPTCDDYGNVPSLTQAMRWIADHLEAHGRDRYRNDYEIRHWPDGMTQADVDESWETFVASDRLERGE